MTSEASIIFCPGSKPVKFTLHSAGPGREWHWPNYEQRQFTGRTWRLLAGAASVELWPLCGDEAQLTESQPHPFDRLEIHPVAWGYPDSLIKDHPAEVEQWCQDHRAGKFVLHDAEQDHPFNWTWPTLLEMAVKPDLWNRFASEELARHWLNKLDGPGQPLFVFAGMTFSGITARIPKSILPEIKFRADFYQGDTCQTIYLHKCAKGNLTDGELRNSPPHIARQEAIAVSLDRKSEQLAAVIKQLDASASRVMDATKVADLYSGPGFADARDAAIRRKVPKDLVAHVMAEFHSNKFPSVGQTLKAVGTVRGLRKLLNEHPSRSSVARWLRIIHEELVDRGLAQPRVKCRSATKVLNYDIEQHPSPAPEDAEPPHECEGETTPDTRSQELPDPQSGE